MGAVPAGRRQGRGTEIAGSDAALVSSHAAELTTSLQQIGQIMYEQADAETQSEAAAHETDDPSLPDRLRHAARIERENVSNLRRQRDEAVA